MSSLIVAKTQPWVLALHGQQTVFVTSWTGTACAAKGCGDVAWKSIRWARCRGRFKELKLEAKKKKKVVVVTFSSLARIFGECSIIHSLPALFFFKVEISSHALFPLFMWGSVHSGSVSWDDCGWMFHDKLHVSLFPDRFPRYACSAA